MRHEKDRRDEQLTMRLQSEVQMSKRLAKLAEIRRLHARGLSDQEIADRTGMSHQMAGNRRRWLGLPRNTRSE